MLWNATSPAHTHTLRYIPEFGWCWQLENSEVLEIPVSIIRDHIVNDPTLNLKLAQELFAQAYESILDNYRYSAQQRYELLVRRCPRILDTATVGDIASFLNISRRQLHRIMKR